MIWVVMTRDLACQSAALGGVVFAMARLGKLLRKGDHVVLFDTGSRDDTEARLADFIACDGFGPDITIETHHAPPPVMGASPPDADHALSWAQQVLHREGPIRVLWPQDLIAQPAPAILGRAHMAVAVMGRHRHLTPPARLGLPARARLVCTPRRADLVVLAHPLDGLELPELGDALAKSAPPALALYSEEPFWDLLFLPDPEARVTYLDIARIGPQPAALLTHAHARVFAFDKLPYAIMADPAMQAGLALRLGAMAQVAWQDWPALWAQRPARAGAMVSRRRGAVQWRDAGAFLMRAGWRSALADHLAQDPRARVCGQGYDHDRPRATIPLWHRDKLLRLRDQAAVILACENAIAPHYVSEKLFDAFALGARPALWRGEAQARLALPEGAYVDLTGCTPEGAAARMLAPDGPCPRAQARDFGAALRQLAGLLADPEISAAEAARMRRALWSDLSRAEACARARPLQIA